MIDRDTERERRRAQQTLFVAELAPAPRATCIEGATRACCFRCGGRVTGIARLHPLDRPELACAQHATHNLEGGVLNPPTGGGK